MIWQETWETKATRSQKEKFKGKYRFFGKNGDQTCGIEAEMLGSLMMLPSGVLASSPRAASSSGIRCSGFSRSGK